MGWLFFIKWIFMKHFGKGQFIPHTFQTQVLLNCKAMDGPSIIQKFNKSPKMTSYLIQAFKCRPLCIVSQQDLAFFK